MVCIPLNPSVAASLQKLSREYNVELLFVSMHVKSFISIAGLLLTFETEEEDYECDAPHIEPQKPTTGTYIIECHWTIAQREATRSISSWIFRCRLRDCWPD